MQGIIAAALVHFLVIPATGEKTLPPVYWFEGGPGIPGTGALQFWKTAGAIYLQHRDVVLFDQRGTGKSEPLDCPDVRIGDPFAPTLDLAAVKACREHLPQDLSRFSTRQAVEDVEAIRASLGHERIDLYGLSYGTRVAQEYLRAHPDRVRAVAMLAALPPFVKLPLTYAKTAWPVLTKLAPESEIAAADKALKPGQRGPFWEWVRGGMASARFQRKLRGLLQEVAQGRMDGVKARKAFGFDGMLLSVSCPEDTLHITEQERDAAAGGVFGTYRLDQQIAACKAWGGAKRDMPREFVKSPAPVLLMSGDMDGITPPEWADDIAAHLGAGARVVHIPGLAHFPDGLQHMECYDQIIEAFFEAGTAKDLDTRCLASMTPSP